jgi:trimeric autotransporter adhesin
MALNKIVLETDGLVVGVNQLIASGGGITVGRNLVVQGNTYSNAVSIQSNIASTSNVTGALTVLGGVGITGNISLGGSLGVGTTASANRGEIRATNAITAFYSDRRLKSNIEPITDALNRLEQITGVFYTQSQLAEQFGYHDYGQQVGVFAQDVQAVLPQVVKPAPFDSAANGSSISGDNYLTIQYEKIIPLLIEAIKELRKEVNELKGK